MHIHSSQHPTPGMCTWYTYILRMYALHPSDGLVAPRLAAVALAGPREALGCVRCGELVANDGPCRLGGTHDRPL